MGVLNGIGGVVDGDATIRSWTAELPDELVEVYASNTQGGPLRLEGNKDWSGSYNGYGSIPNRLPGDFVTNLKLSLDGSIGIDGPAIVDRLEITWDLEGKLPIAYAVNFSGNGEPTLGAAVASDVTLPADEVLPSADTKIELADYDADVPSWYEADNFRSATLAMWRINTTYINSSTAGAVKRLLGNFNASLSFAVHSDDFSKLSASLNTPARGKSMGVKIYTTDTLYWLCEWMKRLSLSDLLCDREGTAMVGMTLNFEFDCALKIGSGSTATIGKIQTPAVAPATVWP